MVYFDNAATTFPKPDSVRAAVNAAVALYGGNPGRGGHDISVKAAQAVFSARQKAADFFGAEPENVVFTLNCTHALNFAIKGIVKRGEHIIISSLEHNASARPVYSLARYGIKHSIAEVSADDNITLYNISRLITPETSAVVFTVGSNVTGQLTPYRRIGELCRRYGICFIADGAQGCGIADINIKRDNINFLCCAAHKGLYAVSGTGLLISDGKYKLSSIIEGGTGSMSMEPVQPDFLPDALESGTINTVGAISLSAGLEHIKDIGRENIYAYEDSLCRRLISALSNNDRIRIYRRKGASYLPIVLFNVEGYAPEETAAYLNEKGFALRAGLHCAPLGHRSIGTLPDGAVRFAPGIFNTADEAERLADAVNELTGRRI